MYCKACGTQYQSDQAAFCVSCGVQRGVGGAYCWNCGKQINPGAAVCVGCGAAVAPQVYVNPLAKSKMAAGLLAIFLGSLGIHNFYLGYTTKGVIQLVVSVGGAFLCGIPTAAIAVWALIEGIYIFTGRISQDANGVPLKD